MKTNLKPVSGTKEWASSNVNIISGCEHNCKYCYACEMAIRFKRKKKGSWKKEKINKKALNKIVNGKSFKKKKGIIMFPTTHDITPRLLPASLIVLEKLLLAGNQVLIVSKPHLECIKAICKKFETYKDKILFRFSIGSTDNKVLKFWDINAPSYKERIKCLKYAQSKGFQTSVSAEPMLDFQPEKLATALLPYITDAIWFGKLNKAKGRLAVNGFSDKETTEKADDLISWQSNDKNILSLYNRFRNNPKVKWKESIKKVVGLQVATELGTDM